MYKKPGWNGSSATNCHLGASDLKPWASVSLLQDGASIPCWVGWEFSKIDNYTQCPVESAGLEPSKWSLMILTTTAGTVKWNHARLPPKSVQWNLPRYTVAKSVYLETQWTWVATARVSFLLHLQLSFQGKFRSCSFPGSKIPSIWTMPVATVGPTCFTQILPPSFWGQKDFLPKDMEIYREQKAL